MTNLKYVNEDVDELIERAKKIVESWDGNHARLWLCANPDDSYDDSRYRVVLYVLEGSPPRGYVLADYYNKTVKLFGISFVKSKTMKVKI